MKLKIISYVTAVGMALCGAHNVLAFPDIAWTGLGNDGLWNDPNNWTNFDNDTASLPESNPQDPDVQIDPANGWSLVTIPAGYTVDLESEDPTEYYNTIYGGEFGMNINIKGTLEYGWMMAPVQDDPTPANRGLINMYSGSTLYSAGAGIGIGDAWWWYEAAPYVTLNMYGDAQLNEPNVALGGHLNIYDTATATVTADVFTGNPLTGSPATGNTVACSDGTASLIVGGGTLILPTGFTNETTFAGNTVYDLIARGVLRAYGKGYDTNDLSIIDNGANTIVTSVPLGGALQRVYFQPLVLSNLTVGDFEQATLVGDYPSVSGVLLSSPEPGLDPALFPAPVYSSSNPNVATVNTNGLVTAVGPGSSTLTATVGGFTTINSVVISVTPAGGTLIHRYSFTSDASDSVGSADGTFNGDATVSGGQLVLDGTQGSSVTLPAGILSGLNEVTIETWATFPSTINPYANLCAFGNTDFNGAGENYLTFSPHTGGLTAQANFGQGDPGNSGERDAVQDTVYDGLTNLQIAIVYHPEAGYEAFYTNGVECASISMFNDLIDPVAYIGPTFTNGSILPYTLGSDAVNYIGQSLYNTDPGLQANIDEFRIYNGALSASQIAADNALGPNQLIGTSTVRAKLTVASSGSNVVFSWPTTSAEVTLLASPMLGSGAAWTPVAIPSGAMTASGGNYQVTLPVSGSAEFFRLSN